MPAPQPPERKPSTPAQRAAPGASTPAPAGGPAAPGAAARAWERLKPILDVALRLYKLDRDAMGELVASPPPLRVALAILAVGAVGFAIGFHRWNMLLIWPLSIVVWLGVTHAVAKGAGGKGSYLSLLRAFSVLTVVDVVAVVGPLGQVVVVLGMLYAAFILSGLVEEHYDVGGTTPLKAVGIGLVVTFALVVGLSMVDAAIRGQGRWGSS
jgi:hypothetical protein